MLSLAWITGHWFDLLQSAGIIGGLLFSGIALQIDARVRRVQNLFFVTKQHREIWSELLTHPELGRILDADVDLKIRPVTRTEELFVRFLLLHLKSVFRAIEADFYVEPEALAKDIHAFLSLPIPRSVWSKERPVHDRNFVSFVERAEKSIIDQN